MMNEDAEDDAEWLAVLPALDAAVGQLNSMKLQEGRQLCDDLRRRIHMLDTYIERIETLGTGRVEIERQRIYDRLAQISGG